jgi:hypothetical protein
MAKSKKQEKKVEAKPSIVEIPDLLGLLGELVVGEDEVFDGVKDEVDDGKEADVGVGSGGSDDRGGIGSININLGDLFKRKPKVAPTGGNADSKEKGKTSGNEE